MPINITYSVSLLSYDERAKGWRVSTREAVPCDCHGTYWPPTAITIQIEKPHYTICPLGRSGIR